MSGYKTTAIGCCVSHLPAGHPNACNDCDPCLMFNPKTQNTALWADWEGMYWEISRLKEELKEKNAEIARLQALVSEAREIITEAVEGRNDIRFFRARSFLNRTGE